MTDATGANVVKTRRGHVLELLLDRPDKKNAIDQPMYQALHLAFERAGADPEIRAVLLGSSGPDFTAGNDLSDFQTGAPLEGSATQRLIETVLRFGKPIVAAVDGLAIGIGTTILLHCDIVIASSAARFRMPFVDLGLVPEFASSLVLPRLAGLQKASELLLLGTMFDVAEAHRIGLVARVVERQALRETADEVAQALAAKPPGALAASRRLIRGDPDALVAHSVREFEAFGERLRSDEAKAAFAAFFSRRK